MIGIITLVAVMTAIIFITKYTRVDTPHPFSCGSDEVCNCAESPNCMKDESKEK